jgi:hypothetical protein
MRLLFTDINQIKEQISVDISQDIRTLKPYIKQAERKIKEIIGTALHSKLLTVVHDGVSDADLESLLEKVRFPLAHYAYMHAVPQLSLTVGDMGIGVTMSQNIEPAAKWRLDDFSASLKRTGDEGLEELLQFLEENKSKYPDWSDSSAYSFQKKLFVNNAREFQMYTMREIPRLSFLNMRESIFRFEQNTVKKIVCTELFNNLKSQIAADDISPQNQFLLDYIRPAACYFALYEVEQKEAFKNEYTRLLEELQEYLNTHAEESYPLYFASDCYSAESTIEKNDEESGLYIMG